MRKLFRIVLIKPSHYDDEGMMRWTRSAIPSNTLACLYTIAEQAKKSGRLGLKADITIDVYDEISQRISVEKSH